MSDVRAAWLADIRDQFEKLKRSAEGAIAQVDDAGFFAAVDVENNSIAVNVKHMGGNLRSRFSDFLTTDGEKPDRDRGRRVRDPPRRDPRHHPRAMDARLGDALLCDRFAWARTIS